MAKKILPRPVSPAGDQALESERRLYLGLVRLLEAWLAHALDEALATVEGRPDAAEAEAWLRRRLEGLDRQRGGGETHGSKR